MMAAVPNNSPVDPAAAMMAKTTNTIAAMRKIPILMLCTFLYSHLLMGSRVRGNSGGGESRTPVLPPSRHPTRCADRATSECAESPMIELPSGKHLLQLSRLLPGRLGITRHLLGTTHKVDDRHDHQDDHECSKTDVHRNLLSWIATVGDHPAADYFG